MKFIQNYDYAFRIISKVLGIAQIKWWLCFGTLLKLIRDRTISEGDDIDIGIFYEEMNRETIVNGFLKWEYKLEKEIIDNVSKKPYYLSFESVNPRKELPPIDVFAWRLHNGIRYHTYDTLRENHIIPSRYVFKGAQDELFPKIGVQRTKDINLTASMFGPKKAPLFTQEIQIPKQYGTLFDLWYPNWLVEKKMQSASKYIVEMSSCKKWKNDSDIKEQLKESIQQYKNELHKYK